MLESMRKHARFFYVLFVIVILSFIFWGVGSVDKSSVPNVAEIGKDKISTEDYWRAYDQARAMFRERLKDQFNEEMEKKINLKGVVLNSLIAERILSLAAVDMGVSVSDDELQDVITHDPMFIRDGVFKREAYFNVLRAQRETTETFENSLRQQIVSDKMRQLIQASAQVNPLDLKNISGDEKAVDEQMRAIITNQGNIALTSYINSLRQRMHVKVNTDIIS